MHRYSIPTSIISYQLMLIKIRAELPDLVPPKTTGHFAQRATIVFACKY